MSKWFECKVEIWKTVLIEVDDGEGEDEAMQAAAEEYLGCNGGEVSNPVEVSAEHLESS